MSGRHIKGFKPLNIERKTDPLRLADPRAAERTTDLGLPERRRRTRYPVVLLLRFQTLVSNLHYGAAQSGHTVDFASQGFLVSTDEPMPTIGSKIRARVDWPVALDGKLPLQFVVTGHVVRVGEKCFGVSFERHELCTVKRGQGNSADQIRWRQADSA